MKKSTAFGLASVTLIAASFHDWHSPFESRIAAVLVISSFISSFLAAKAGEKGWLIIPISFLCLWALVANLLWHHD